MKPMNCVEKIFSRKAGKTVQPGDFVTVTPDALMIHDNNAPGVMSAFKGLPVIDHAKKTDIVMVNDHFTPAPTEYAAKIHLQMQDFANQHGILLYQDGIGVCHQLMCEKGHVFPGEIVVGTDSHSCTYGALNAIGTGIGGTEAAGIICSGQIWFRVPESIRIHLQGIKPWGVMAMDLALSILKRLGLRQAIYCALEFGGSLIEQLSVEERMTIANMGVEAGAKTVIMPFDDKLESWLLDRPRQRIYEPVRPDADAAYRAVYDFDIDTLSPLVACPPPAEDIIPITQMEKRKIHQVIIGSCTNGRIDDFVAAASLLKNKTIAPWVRLLLIPASHQVLIALVTNGSLETLLRAGATVFTPGCGPCGGFHGGLVGDGEVVLSTTSRNFTGRMGSPKAEIYLASPLTAAATALNGYFTDPRTIREG